MRKALVMQEVESGRLIHLLPHQRWPVKWAYYVVAVPKALRRYEVNAFHDWLLRIATGDSEHSGSAMTASGDSR